MAFSPHGKAQMNVPSQFFHLTCAGTGCEKCQYTGCDIGLALHAASSEVQVKVDELIEKIGEWTSFEARALCIFLRWNLRGYQLKIYLCKHSKSYVEWNTVSPSGLPVYELLCYRIDPASTLSIDTLDVDKLVSLLPTL